jgi:hypothetical protein
MDDAKDSNSAEKELINVVAAADNGNPRVTGAQGGRARARAMSAKARQEAARQAAKARWSHLRATHTGILHIGDIEIECAVLENGRRVISDSAFQKALGRAAAGGQTYQRRAAENNFDQLPIYVALKNLKPFIPKGFSVSTIHYIRPGGGLAIGVDAAVIPAVCSIWLTARLQESSASNSCAPQSRLRSSKTASPP